MCLLVLWVAQAPLEALAAEMHTQLGHTGAVVAVGVSPDGSLAMSADDSGNILLWDISTGKELRAFKAHPAILRDAALASDGKTVLSAGSVKSFEDELKLWDLGTGREIRAFGAQKQSPHAVALSSDGRFALSGGADSTAHLWDVATGRELWSSRGHKSLVTTVAFSPDGTQALSGESEGVIKLWDLKTKKEKLSVRLHSLVQVAQFSPDGKYVASAGDRGGTTPLIRLWDTTTGAEVRTFLGPTKSIEGLAFSPDGRRLLSGSNDGIVTIWDVQTGQATRSFPGGGAILRATTFTPDGKGVFVGGANRAIRLWDAETGNELRAFDRATRGINAIDFNRSGSRLVSAHADGTLGLWDLTSVRYVRSFAKQRGGVKEVAFDPDGRTIAAGSTDGTIRLWDASTGQLVGTLSGHTKAVAGLAFAPDGRSLFSGSADGTIRVWNTAQKSMVRSFTDPADRISQVAFSPDGTTALVVGSSKEGQFHGVARLWDLASGKEVRSFIMDRGQGIPNGNAFDSAAFSPDGKQVLLGAWTDVGLFEVATGRQLALLRGHPANVASLRFSPDGKQALAASHSAVYLWDLSKASSVSFDDHAFLVTSLAFSPDGTFAVSAGRDGKLVLRNRSTEASLNLVSSSRGDWVAYTSDGIFDASPSGGDLVAMVDGFRGFNIDQLALKNNRPDLLLTRAGLGTPELLDHFKAQFLRRLKKTGLTESLLSSSLEALPVATITKVGPLIGGSVDVQLSLEDKQGLRSHQVYVNAVPLFSEFGKSISGKQVQLQLKVPLTEGPNRIEVSATNEAGQESLRALALVDGPPKLQGELYFLGFGVSEYEDPDISDLSYAHKDVRDLAATFSRVRNFAKTHVKTYVNQEVTVANIRAAKSFLTTTRPQDTIVLAIAGHGLHDADAAGTYYFVTHEARRADLGNTAASFELVEDLLSGVEARQKLFLMDTCESGEAEDGQVPEAVALAGSRGIKVVGVANKVSSKSTPRPWLAARDRFIYLDLSRRTGAIVFSSSRGGELSYESEKLGNGLFSSAILKAMSGAADGNKDGLVSTLELREYVATEVGTLSQDLQHPTVDRDNTLARFSFAP